MVNDKNNHQPDEQGSDELTPKIGDEQTSTEHHEQGPDESAAKIEPSGSVLAELSEKEKLRYSYLYRFYGKYAIKLIFHLRAGDIEWAQLVRTISVLDTASSFEKRYYLALYNAIGPGQPMLTEAVYDVIGQVRKELGLPAYGRDEEHKYFRDLDRIYIVRVDYGEYGEPSFVPIFKLMPDNTGID